MCLFIECKWNSDETLTETGLIENSINIYVVNWVYYKIYFIINLMILILCLNVYTCLYSFDQIEIVLLIKRWELHPFVDGGSNN